MIAFFEGTPYSKRRTIAPCLIGPTFKSKMPFKIMLVCLLLFAKKKHIPKYNSNFSTRICLKRSQHVRFSKWVCLYQPMNAGVSFCRGPPNTASGSFWLPVNTHLRGAQPSNKTTSHPCAVVFKFGPPTKRKPKNKPKEAKRQPQEA